MIVIILVCFIRVRGLKNLSELTHPNSHERKYYPHLTDGGSRRFIYAKECINTTGSGTNNSSKEMFAPKNAPNLAQVLSAASLDVSTFWSS